jgi:hypothetical protein
MKLQLFAIVFCSMIAFSCDDNPLPAQGYIKSKINGVETIYSTGVDNNIIHFMGSNELHISFQKNNNKYLTWTISITGVDFQNIEFPFVISGPKDTGLNEPAFWCNITDSDPKNSAYGRSLAGTTSLQWDATLTLTSVEGNRVTGTFEGEGQAGGNPGIFSGGEFVATFK